MRLLLLLVFMVCIAPVKMGAAVHWREGENVRLALGVTCWGVRFTKRYLKPEPVGKLGMQEEKRHTSEALQVEGREEKGNAADSKGLRALVRMLRTVMIGNHARHYFRRSSRMDRFLILLQTGTQDAALCALADAFMKTVVGILRTRLPVGFYGAQAVTEDKAGIQVLCIVSIRLGNLFIAALLGTIAYLVSGRRKKEERRWNIIPFRT